MNRREDRIVEEREAGYSAPVLKAVALHLVVAMMLFVSFTSAPEFEPARPIVQATLVQLSSQSPATTPTDQRIAGEAARTAAPRHEAEELQRKQQQAQEQQEATRRAEAQKQAAAAAARAEQEKQAAAAAAAKSRAEAEEAAKRKAAEELQRKADAAKKLAADEAQKKAAEAEAAKKKAAEEAKRKAEEEAKRKAAEAAKAKAAEEAKQKAAADARKAEADRAARQKREAEEARARALAELLAEEAQYQQAPADRMGDQVAASYDDVIRRYVSEQWRRPPTARNGMVVEVRISMLPTGQITDVVVSRSSGDAGFDQSAVQAVRNVGRIPEMQQLSREDPATFERMYRQRVLRFKPEDLSF